MKELADISTFNRLCVSVNNANAFGLAPFPDEYGRYRVKGPSGKLLTTAAAKTDIGKYLMGQQILYHKLYQEKGSYTEYLKCLKDYKAASRVFKNMWASAVKHECCRPEIKNLRYRIADFDSSVNQFLYDLQNNQIYKENF